MNIFVPKKQLISTFIGLCFIMLLPKTVQAVEHPRFWEIQSIDTMKYSRDKSREWLGNRNVAQDEIEKITENIADAGATHIVIATPYDEEFYPILIEWVTAARGNDLHVWFRGNWSGWEGWFDYQPISREEHLAKTRQFILSHPELFEDGDIFTPCPECENGGPGDPRQTGDVTGFRTQLIQEYEMTQAAFAQIHKEVATNFASMNGDVAALIMTPATTDALDNVVTVDHYVESSKQLANDVSEYANKSEGQVVLGEFGAPIPDLHPHMTDLLQADWLNNLLTRLTDHPESLIVFSR